MSKEFAQLMGGKKLGFLVIILSSIAVVLAIAQKVGSSSPQTAVSALPGSAIAQSISMPTQAVVLPDYTSLTSNAVGHVDSPAVAISHNDSNIHTMGAANALYALVGSGFLIDSTVLASKSSLQSVVDNARIHGLSGSRAFGTTGVFVAIVTSAMTIALYVVLISSQAYIARRRECVGRKPQGGIYKRAQAPMLQLVPVEATS